MQTVVAWGICLCGILGPVAWTADRAAVFFDDSQVQEIRLTFSDPNWFETLRQGHELDPDDPYFPARFEFGDVVLDPVGVRFDGQTSYQALDLKKPLKIDFQQYDKDNFLGLDTLTLDNLHDDPSYLRSKLFLDAAGRYLAAPRAVHCRVVINGEPWGLYLAVEPVDRDFVQQHFGRNEDGNLFKAVAGEQERDDGVVSDLTWLGEDDAAYRVAYKLKTNESADDYSDLIALIDALNHSVPDVPDDLLDTVLDVDPVLWALALNNLFVNLDSYSGSADDYYLYHRDDSGRFVLLHADGRGAFGQSLTLLGAGDDPLRLSAFWLPTVGGQKRPRPLLERLWARDDWRHRYLRYLSVLVREVFDETAFPQRLDALADVIAADVAADPFAATTLEDFQTNLTDDLQRDGRTWFGLRRFARERAAALQAELAPAGRQSDLRLNEVVTRNVTSAHDEAQQADPWIELYNLGPGQVSLAGATLSNDPAGGGGWVLPDETLPAGGYRLLWLDGQPEQGPLHSPFTGSDAGGWLELRDVNGILVDALEIPALAVDQSYGVTGEGHHLLDAPTPGGPNLWTYRPPRLFINEFMADNETTLEDPDEPGAFEDWVELYNAENHAVDLSGMYLTDDPEDPQKWEIPYGLQVPAGGHVLFWLDGDPKQGPWHVDFKLSRSGETIALFDTDAHDRVLIDRVDFAEQQTDVSFGRAGDGSAQWRAQTTPTPGQANPVQ